MPDRGESYSKPRPTRDLVAYFGGSCRGKWERSFDLLCEKHGQNRVPRSVFWRFISPWKVRAYSFHLWKRTFLLCQKHGQNRVPGSVFRRFISPWKVGVNSFYHLETHFCEKTAKIQFLVAHLCDSYHTGDMGEVNIVSFHFPYPDAGYTAKIKYQSLFLQANRGRHRELQCWSNV